MHTDNKKHKELIESIDIGKIAKNPNILIAANFWDEEKFNAAKTVYKFMRVIDDLIDDHKAKFAELSCFDKELFTKKINSWILCLQGEKSDEGIFMDEVIETVNTFKIPIQYFHDFARAMIYDINNEGFKTFDDFLEYSNGAANGPAAVFLHLCCLDKKNGEYFQPIENIADLARPCALFSYLVHIIRDFQKDQDENLNYFALDILERNDVSPFDLKAMSKGAEISQGFRNVVKDYLAEAEKYKIQTIEVIHRLREKISDSYLLSLNVIFDLYLQIFERIDIENGSFTSEELIPSPSEVKERVLKCLGDL
ncbi:phytoene/squalene synthase family protein [Bacteroidota bacterium]